MPLRTVGWHTCDRDLGRQLKLERLDELRAVVPHVADRLADRPRHRVPRRHRGEDVRLYNAAISDGWSPDELRKLGLAEPEK